MICTRNHATFFNVLTDSKLLSARVIEQRKRLEGREREWAQHSMKNNKQFGDINHQRF